MQATTPNVPIANFMTGGVAHRLVYPELTIDVFDLANIIEEITEPALDTKKCAMWTRRGHNLSITGS
jgi:hypothetical protein